MGFKDDLIDKKNEIKEAFKSTDINRWRFKKSWPLGLISFFGLPQVYNLMLGKEYSVVMLLCIFGLIFFIPERRGRSHLEITKEEIEYYRKNPDEISLINNATNIRYKYLSYAFVLGFILVVASKLMVPGLSMLLSDFWAEVLRDMSFEMGVALWGGAVTAFIMEMHALKEEEDCKRKQEMLRKLLNLEDRPDPNVRPNRK